MIKLTFADDEFPAKSLTYFRVRFQTKKKQGILLQIRDASNMDYISLQMNNAGNTLHCLCQGLAQMNKQLHVSCQNIIQSNNTCFRSSFTQMNNIFNVLGQDIKQMNDIFYMFLGQNFTQMSNAHCMF